jgi:hypothetical protein
VAHLVHDIDGDQDGGGRWADLGTEGSVGPAFW